IQRVVAAHTIPRGGQMSAETDIKCLLKGLKCEPSAKDDSLQSLSESLGHPLPPDYLTLLGAADGASGWSSGHYLIIFSAREAIGVNRAAQISKFAPGMFIFG